MCIYYLKPFVRARMINKIIFYKKKKISHVAAFNNTLLSVKLSSGEEFYADCKEAVLVRLFKTRLKCKKRSTLGSAELAMKKTTTKTI